MNKFTFGLVLLFALPARTQELDLATCLQMADTANLTIRNSRIDVEINKRQTAVYNSARLPHVNFEADYRYNAIIPGQVVPAALFGGPPGQFETLQFGVPLNLGNSLSASQVLFNPQINYGLSVLDIMKQVEDTKASLTNIEVKNQVATTYFTLQGINKQLSFIDFNMNNLDKLISNVDALYKNGLTIESEVDKLRINKLSLESQKISLNATKLQVETLLKILIGANENFVIQLKSDEIVEQSVLAENKGEYHPELELIKAQQTLNEEERKGTNMAYLPSLAAYAAYQYNINIDPDADFRQGIETAIIGLKLNWTIFDGLEKSRKQKVNALNKEKLQNQFDLTEQQLKMHVNSTQRQIVAQAASLETAKKQLELSEKVMRQTQSQFNNGTISSNDLIQAQNALEQAQTALINAYISLRQAEIAFLKATGNL